MSARRHDSVGNASPGATVRVTIAAPSAFGPAPSAKVHGKVRLSWPVKKGAKYYNVQVFRNGTRVLVDWPSRPFFRLPANLLEAGTYTWYVWPALKGKGSEPTFGDLIGHATFRYEK